MVYRENSMNEPKYIHDIARKLSDNDWNYDSITEQEKHEFETWCREQEERELREWRENPHNY